MNGLEQRHSGQTLARDRLLRHAPHARDVPSVLPVLDVARSGEVVAFLPLLTSSLPVALPSDHRVPASLAADAARPDHQVERGHAVLHAFRVVLDSARMKQEASLRRAPHLRRFNDERRRHAGDLRAVVGRVLLDYFLYRLPPRSVLGDEGAVDPATADHHVQHCVEHADVATGLDRDEEIDRAGDGREPRVEHDDLRTVLARLPDIIGGDRRAFRHVRARDEQHFRLGDVAPRISRPVDAVDFL